MARLNINEVTNNLSAEDIPKFLAFYDMFKHVLDGLLHKKHKETPVVPNQPPIANPVPVPPVPKEPVYRELRAKVFFNERNGNSNVGLPQMVNDRLHIDISPFDENKQEIRTGDPRHVKIPGDVPVRYRWWRDGKLNTHGEYHGMPPQEEDHFELQSVIDEDNGFTPVLQLVTGEPGGHTVEFEAFIPAEFNNGLEVVSNRISWPCD